jgi:hypothetical protein
VILVPIFMTPRHANVENFNAEIAAVPVPQARLLEHVVTVDGLHLSAESYVEWKKNILDAANSSICGPIGK